MILSSNNGHAAKWTAPGFLESVLSVNSGCQIIVSDGSIKSFFCFCRRDMTQPFQQSSIVIPVHPRECGQLIIIHGSCISVRRFYIRTAPLWPLLCSMQYTQDIHFSPLAIDLINQNKMRVNNQFPGTFHTTVAAFIRLPGQAAGWITNPFVQFNGGYQVLLRNVLTNALPVRPGAVSAGRCRQKRCRS